MLTAVTREQWLAALLVLVLAAPIVGITLYFFNSAQQRIAFAQSERSGLSQIDRLERLLVATVAYGSAITCGKPGNLNQLRAQADDRLRDVEMFAMQGSRPVTMAAMHSTWQQLRLSTNPRTNFSPFFDALTAAFINVSDDSGLTFDPEIEGLDLGDSLAYRLPRSIDFFASTQRRMCRNAGSLTLDDRLQLAIGNAEGNARAMDASQDIDDALQRGNPTKLLAVSRAYATSRTLLADATQKVYNYSKARAQNGRLPTVATLGQLIASLAALMEAEEPTIDSRIAARIRGVKRERLLNLVPGIFGIVAVIAMVLLLHRVLYSRARIRAAEQAAAEHERAAMHDSLTGLLNRRAFLAAIENAAADGSSPGVLCLIDLDDFKAINDTYGHMVGDEVLKRMSRIIEGAIRSTDASARIGGDEFSLFLRSPIDRLGVKRVASSIARDAREPTSIRGHALSVKISIGAATIAGRSAELIDEAFSLADAALYAAKRNNRGGVEFADEIAG